MTIHANSHAAWRTLDIGMRQAAVLDVYREASEPLTDRQVGDRLGLTDLNGCKPRITELVRLGHLIERGSAKDAVTGRSVRLCAPASLL